MDHDMMLLTGSQTGATVTVQEMQGNVGFRSSTYLQLLVVLRAAADVLKLSLDRLSGFLSTH